MTRRVGVWTTLAHGAASAAETVANHRLRSALTLLGVAVGVLGVLAIAAYGQYASIQVASILAQFGSNLITVTPSAPQVSGARVGQVRTLTIDDASAIRDQVPQLVAVSGVRSESVTAVAGANSWKTQVAGVSRDFPMIQGLDIEAGVFFGSADQQNIDAVAVLGSHVATQLFGDAVGAIDQSVRMNGSTFRVIGVLAPRGVTINGNLDDVIYVPLLTALRRLYGGAYLNRIEVRAARSEAVLPAMAAIGALLEDRHHIQTGRPNDFQVQSHHQVAERSRQTVAAISGGLTAGAVLALAIAGFGVMNIMLVSVSERTPEIGVRLAVGARGADVRAQFLSEALALCLGGVVVGTVLGLVAGQVLGQRVGFNVLPSLAAFVAAGGTSLLVGLLFGLYPAERASRLDPIVALRSD